MSPTANFSCLWIYKCAQVPHGCPHLAVSVFLKTSFRMNKLELTLYKHYTTPEKNRPFISGVLWTGLQAIFCRERLLVCSFTFSKLSESRHLLYRKPRHELVLPAWRTWDLLVAPGDAAIPVFRFILLNSNQCQGKAYSRYCEDQDLAEDSHKKYIIPQWTELGPHSVFIRHPCQVPGVQKWTGTSLTSGSWETETRQTPSFSLLPNFF